MQYATDIDFVKKAIEHLLDIKRRENIRANQRKLNVQKRNEKGFDKYNWEELTVNGGLNKLTVSELDKYLSYHRLPNLGKSWTKLSVSPVTRADQTLVKCNLWLPPGRYVMKM